MAWEESRWETALVALAYGRVCGGLPQLAHRGGKAPNISSALSQAGLWAKPRGEWAPSSSGHWFSLCSWLWMGATPSSPASLSSQQWRTTWNCEPNQTFSLLNCFLSGIWSQWQARNQGSCPDAFSLWGWKCFLLLSQSTGQGTFLSFISSFCMLGKSIVSPKNVISDTSYLSRACSGPGQLVNVCTPRTKQELVSWFYDTCLEGSEIPLKGQLSTRILHLSAPPSTTGLVSTALATTGPAPVTTGSAQPRLPQAIWTPGRTPETRFHDFSKVRVCFVIHSKQDLPMFHF